MAAVWHDVRFGARLLKKSPAFTVVSVLSLGLGIGANTAIFSLINTVFFRSIKVDRPEELVLMFTRDPASPGYRPVSQPNFRDFRGRSRSFTELAAFVTVPLNLSMGAEPEQVFGEMVTGNFFELLGARAAIGRTITPENDEPPGGHPVVVLSHRLWGRRFGADRSAVGRTGTLNGRAFTVIGVMPDGFRGLSALGGAEAWVPSGMYQELMQQPRYYNSRRALLFLPVGRLKPGIGLQAAQQELNRIARDLEREFPNDNRNRTVDLAPAVEALIRPDVRGNLVRAGVLLMTVVGLVLLIACANVGGLLLARAEARRKEVAIRLAAGAGRARLVAQLLTEAVLLSGLGGVAGLAIGWWGRNLLLGLAPAQLAIGEIDLPLDLRVLAFTLACSMATAILFGLAPALTASRSDLALNLRDRSTAGSRGRMRGRLRSVLVGGEVALSTIALVCAGLFIRSLSNARQIPLGFDAGRLVVIEFQPGSQGYTQARALDLYRRAEDRVNTIPGVRAASVSAMTPLGLRGVQRSVFPEGQEQSPDQQGRPVWVNSVGTRYFEATGITLLNGRAFTDADHSGAQLVAIVNETMARTYWPGRDAVGKRFKFFGAVDPTVVVGVARDSKYFSVGEAAMPLAYLPMRQYYTPAATLLVRVDGRPEATLGASRREVQSLDPSLPLTKVAAMRGLLDRSLWTSRAGASVLTAFAGLALLLAAVGLYGVMAYAVESRVNEIGIRLALGANPSSMLGVVIGGGLQVVGLGMLCGLLLAVAVARGIGSLLYGVEPYEPAVLLPAAAVLTAVAALACLIPAWRATRVDPMIALRHQ